MDKAISTGTIFRALDHRVTQGKMAESLIGTRIVAGFPSVPAHYVTLRSVAAYDGGCDIGGTAEWHCEMALRNGAANFVCRNL